MSGNEVAQVLPERAMWERARRTVLAFVAMIRDLDPDGRYTLDVTIVPRDKQARKPA